MGISSALAFITQSGNFSVQDLPLSFNLPIRFQNRAFLRWYSPGPLLNVPVHHLISHTFSPPTSPMKEKRTHRTASRKGNYCIFLIKSHPSLPNFYLTAPCWSKKMLPRRVHCTIGKKFSKYKKIREIQKLMCHLHSFIKITRWCSKQEKRINIKAFHSFGSPFRQLKSDLQDPI